MQELITWLVTALMTASLFFAGFSAKTGCMEKRRVKQEMNLAGRVSACYCELSGDGISIDEDKATERIKTILNNDSFCGAVYVYSDRIVGIDAYGKRFETEISSDENEKSMVKISETNRMICRISGNTSEDDVKLIIESSTEKDSEDGSMRSKLFNIIPDSGITVFLLSKGREYVEVTGYTLETA